MHILDYILVCLSAVVVVYGFYIIYLKRRAQEARMMAYFIILSGIWIFFIGLGNLSQNEIQLVLLTRFCVITSVLAILFFLLFVSKFRNLAINPYWANRYYLAFVLIFIIVVASFPSQGFLTDMAFKENVPPAGKLNFQLSFFFVLLIVLMLVKSSYILLANFYSLPGRQRTQIQYVLLGGIMAIFGGALFDAILPWLLNDERFYSIGPLFFIFFIGCTSYAIIKHELLDIKAVIQRGLIYSFLLALITAFYLAVLSFFAQILEFSSETTSMFSALSTVIIGIFTVPYIEKFFQQITSNIFFKNKYDYSKSLFALSESLNRNIDLEPMLSESNSKLKKILNPDKILFFFPEQNLVYNRSGRMEKTKYPFSKTFKKSIENSGTTIFKYREISEIIKRMDGLGGLENNSNIPAAALKILETFCQKFNAEIIIALNSNKNNIGLIALGGKLSGDEYNSEDISLLKTFAFQASTAIDKARLYEEVKNYSIILEDKVKQRTAKIKAIQEEQMQTMLEIAHGLQTPLTIMKGELEIINIDAEQKESLWRSIDRISKFIYDMLNLSRLEASATQLKMEKFSLSDLMEEIIESLEIIAADKNVSIENFIESGVEMIGNRQKIEELLTNLASNSIKYMDDSRDKKIILSLRQKGSIILSIEDTGIGISQENLPKLFKKFFRVQDGSRKGTGLGLAICRRIVELHQGKIKVDSELGKGTRFVIELKPAEQQM